MGLIGGFDTAAIVQDIVRERAYHDSRTFLNRFTIARTFATCVAMVLISKDKCSVRLRSLKGSGSRGGRARVEKLSRGCGAGAMACPSSSGTGTRFTDWAALNGACIGS